MGWLAREVGTHVYGMASWHLFHQDRFTGWAIRKMGGFSVYREGIDRKAINTATEILARAERPLIIFPEGVVTRTNDKLNALLDGVAFIARTAAKKRKKLFPDGKIMIHPVAIKYVFRGDLPKTLDPVLAEIETRLSWQSRSKLPLMERIRAVGFALLTLKELEYFGQPKSGRLSDRLNDLVNRILHPLEEEWLDAPQEGSVIPRIKTLRMKILPDMVNGEMSEEERARRWTQLADIYLSQQIVSYPPDYVSNQPTVDRLLETVERYEEDLTDQVRVHGDLHAILEVGNRIEVSLKRDRKAMVDPIMNRIEEELQAMLDQLAQESRIWTPDSESTEPAQAVETS